MNIDGHYYAILAFCRACGFKKSSAQTIAYASQYVDDAKINLLYFNNSRHKAECDMVQMQPAFFNIATCHNYFRIYTFNYEAMVNNTIAFHFVPGLIGKTFSQKLRCIEEPPILLDLMNEALHEDDLLKFGIVLHAYADSFAHQGFSGMLSKVNLINHFKANSKLHERLLERFVTWLRGWGQERFEKYFDRIVPAYGHGQALEFPDLPYLEWSYESDPSDDFNGSSKYVEIDNKDRYQRAFRRIRKHLENFLIKYPHHFDPDVKFTDFELLFKTLIFEAHNKAREKNWRKVLIHQGLFSQDDMNDITYEENKWLKQAFTNYNRKAFDKRIVHGAQLADNFLNSNWYHFTRAVKWYKKNFFKYCSKYDFNIPN